MTHLVCQGQHLINSSRGGALATHMGYRWRSTSFHVRTLPSTCMFQKHKHMSCQHGPRSARTLAAHARPSTPSTPATAMSLLTTALLGCRLQSTSSHPPVKKPSNSITTIQVALYLAAWHVVSWACWTVDPSPYGSAAPWRASTAPARTSGDARASTPPSTLSCPSEHTSCRSPVCSMASRTDVPCVLLPAGAAGTFEVEAAMT